MHGALQSDNLEELAGIMYRPIVISLEMFSVVLLMKSSLSSRMTSLKTNRRRKRQSHY